MNPIIMLIECIFLIIISVVDIKTFNKEEGGIPSFLTTAFIFIVLILTGINGLLYGLLAGAFAWFLVDVGLFKGIPDIKVLIAVGCSFTSLFPFLIFLAVMLFAGTIMQTAILKFTKISKEKGEMPYIPIMALSYLFTLGVFVL